MICPRCQTENRDGAVACRSCGQPIGGAPAGTRMCPAGRHPMDPSWTECPYCRNTGGAPARGRTVPEGPEQVGRRKTVAEGGAAPSAAAGPAPVEPPGKSRRGPTKFMADDAAPAPGAPGKAQPSVARKIVAVLATYSWKAEGQVFPVYEGRNYLGSDPECEVCQTSDPQMSSRHSSIVYRGGTFLLDDASSMNGTFLEDQDVLEKVRLTNYARIRTGATHWVFIMLQPGENA